MLQVKITFREINTVRRGTLPTLTLLPPSDDIYEEPHVLRRYRFGSERPVVSVEIKVYLRPIALELLYELRDEGLLSRSGLMPSLPLSLLQQIELGALRTPYQE